MREDEDFSSFVRLTVSGIFFWAIHVTQTILDNTSHRDVLALLSMNCSGAIQMYWMIIKFNSIDKCTYIAFLWREAIEVVVTYCVGGDNRRRLVAWWRVIKYFTYRYTRLLYLSLGTYINHTFLTCGATRRLLPVWLAPVRRTREMPAEVRSVLLPCTSLASGRTGSNHVTNGKWSRPMLSTRLWNSYQSVRTNLRSAEVSRRRQRWRKTLHCRQPSLSASPVPRNAIQFCLDKWVRRRSLAKSGRSWRRWWSAKQWSTWRLQ